MRSLLTTALELAGFGLLIAAGFTVAVPVGLVVAGVSCILIGYLGGRA